MPTMSQCTSSAHFWLPVGVKWCRLKRGDDALYFLHAVPWVALLIVLLRTIVESWIATPLGNLLDIPDKTCNHPAKNGVLHKAYKECQNPTLETIQKLSKVIDWNPFRVQRWFWRARNYKKPSVLTKFKESCWRCAAYTSSTLIGLWFISNESFFWDHVKSYSGYPSNTPSQPVLIYWTCQTAFYISLLISQFKDIKRNDFFVMMSHHAVTIALLAICYIINTVQIGVLILLVHDLSDIPLELAKLFHYAKMDKKANMLFGTFAIVFLTTRLVVYPFWLIRSVMFELPKHTGPFPAHNIILAMLLTLQVFHLYWSKTILSMGYDLCLNKKLTKDSRSESELSSADEHERIITMRQKID